MSRSCTFLLEIIWEVCVNWQMNLRETKGLVLKDGIRLSLLEVRTLCMRGVGLILEVHLTH